VGWQSIKWGDEVSETTETSEGVSIEKPDLDRNFGDAINPNRVEPLEGSMKPLSYNILSKDTAKILRDLMMSATCDLKISEYTHRCLPILWLIDESGNIIIALEEVYISSDRDFLHPRFKGQDLSDMQARLGHPALVGGKAARIGGELIFDPGATPPTWVLTNESGRYGLRSGRTRQHLENAAAAFRALGIELDAFFTNPRRVDTVS
jgi:hypothetical protein